MITWAEMQDMARDVHGQGLEPLWLNGQVLVVHGQWLCRPPCCIHAPSDHHMVMWPLLWRSDRRLFERVCEHGTGHPDPDDMAFKRNFMTERQWDAERTHGCDFCCT